MEQRSPNAKNKKIHPFVPAQLVADSEAEFRHQVASGVRGASVPKVQGSWAVLGWQLHSAPTYREAAKILRTFRAGKPIPTVKDGAK